MSYYLTIIRLNNSFGIDIASQNLQDPRDSHWEAVVCIHQYIKTHQGQSVQYEG